MQIETYEIEEIKGSDASTMAADSEAIELIEKLGRRDLCPCGSGRRFQGVLHEGRPL